MPFINTGADYITFERSRRVTIGCAEEIMNAAITAAERSELNRIRKMQRLRQSADDNAEWVYVNVRQARETR